MRWHHRLIYSFLILQIFLVSGSSDRPYRAHSLSKQSRRQENPSVLTSASSMSSVHQRKSPQPTQQQAGADDMPPRGGSDAVAPPATDTDKMSKLTKLRRTVFPIYGKQETTKFLLIGSIKFFIIMALTLTRDTKDTLVVTQCGAEAIAFLKVCH